MENKLKEYDIHTSHMAGGKSYQSYWGKASDAGQKLDGDISADVCVIGGGLAGITAAYFLAKAGKSVCVLEADRVGFGETANSSAIVTFAHDLIYSRLAKKLGIDYAQEYYEKQSDAATEIERIIKEENIDCDYKKADMFLFCTTKKGQKEIEDEFAAMGQLNIECGYSDENELSLKVLKSIKIPNQHYLNPVKYILGLAEAVKRKGVKIYENTLVVNQPKDNALKVGAHTVRADKFVIATHFPYLLLPGFYFLRTYQHRSHNVIFKTNTPLKNIYESAEDDGFEFRPAGSGEILCGGANVRTGKYKYESQYKIVEDYITGNFSDALITNRFSAQDCMTFDMLPFAGQYSALTKDILFISGFNKWGFTNSVACAEIITDIVCGKAESTIFSPFRHKFFASAKEAVIHTGEIAMGFLEYIVNLDTKKFKRIQNGQGAVIKHKFKRLGVYRDENGKLFAVKAKCTHMGCSLKWNKDEKSWDCGCHGSRFDIYGRVLTNPALKNLDVVELKENKK